MVGYHRDPVRIATWNVNSLAQRLPRVVEWLDAVRPDVLCLQETKVQDSQLPVSELDALGYSVVGHGTGRWNGVAIVSRVGLEDITRSFAGEPGFPDLEARALAATCAGVRVWSVYVPNGRAIGTPAFAYKLEWLQALHASLQADPTHLPLAICGDFNIAPDDDDVWDPDAFVDSTHVTPGERAALRALLDLGLVDVKPRALKGRPFTYWDYRAGCFHKGMGMRIDLVLLSGHLAPQVADAYIDREARKGSRPSDHAPVVIDLRMTEA